MLTLVTTNWKSAPTTTRHNPGNENAQYESPDRCTAMSVKDTTYENAPTAVKSLLDTLCWMSAATALTSKPQTNIGSMCTPVIRALYFAYLWNQRESQKAATGKPTKPKEMMASNYMLSATFDGRNWKDPTREKSLSFQILILIIA